MPTDPPPEQQSRARPDESLPACPNCGDPVLRVVTHGPGDHTAVPCGCALADGRAVEPPVGGDQS